MKKVVSAIAVLSILFAGCDKVLIPQQEHTVVVPTSDTIRKIFIEDFTGHLCQNCPEAAHQLEALKAAYPNQVIGMAVHSTYWAEPCDGNPPVPTGATATFLDDFRTTENADYEVIYGISNWPYPIGMINRYGTSPIDPLAVEDWASRAATLLQDSMTAYIKINPTYNSTTRVLNVTVTGEFLCDTTGTYNIALYLTESGIIGGQVDESIQPDHIDNFYEFNDIFRGCINTPGTISGELLTLPTTIPGHTAINYTSPSFTVNAAFNDANCKIIAILINNADRGVLQAAEVELQ
jgi:hypothetical protein